MNDNTRPFPTNTDAHGDLYKCGAALANAIEPHVWDNMTAAQQREWLVLQAHVLQLHKYEQAFELRWNADRRAIAKWREGHPERELVLPDQADLCGWLLSELDAKELARGQWADTAWRLLWAIRVELATNRGEPSPILLDALAGLEKP